MSVFFTHEILFAIIDPKKTSTALVRTCCLYLPSDLNPIPLHKMNIDHDYNPTKNHPLAL